MKSAWRIILIVIIVGSVSALGYFYFIGNKTNSQNDNITIVRRIVDDSQNSQASDDANIDQTITNLTNDINGLQVNKDAGYLNEIMQDLKGF